MDSRDIEDEPQQGEHVATEITGHDLTSLLFTVLGNYENTNFGAQLPNGRLRTKPSTHTAVDDAVLAYSARASDFNNTNL
jgi:hypothetical protein